MQFFKSRSQCPPADREGGCWAWTSYCYRGRPHQLFRGLSWSGAALPSQAGRVIGIGSKNTTHQRMHSAASLQGDEIVGDHFLPSARLNDLSLMVEIKPKSLASSPEKHKS